MEMTDRRPINTSVKSRSSSSSTTMEEGNCGRSSWCNDNSMPRNRAAVSNNTNDKLMGVSRMKRFHVVLYLIAALSFYHLVSKGPSVLDPGEVSHVEKKNSTDHTISDSSNIYKISEDIETPPSSNFGDIDTDPKNLPTTEETQTPTSKPTSNRTNSYETSDERKETIENTGGENNIEVDIKGNSLNNESFVGSQEENENVTDSTPTIEGITQQKDFMDNLDNDTNDSAYEQSKTGNNSYVEWKNDTDANGIASTIPLSSPSSQERNDFREEPRKNSTKNNSITPIRAYSEFLKPLSDSDLSPVALNFAQTHCDLTNLKDGAWYPSGPEDDWQQRAPYLIVAGVWNAGVNPLAKALSRHPQIVATQKTDFFLPKNFDGKFSTTNNKNINTSNQTTAIPTTSSFKVKVFPARKRMQVSHYSKATLSEKLVNNDEELTATAETAKIDDGNNAKKQLVAIDVSPGLIFHAHQTAHWILCTTPWVKVVVLLRNPIDRLYRQWSYGVSNLNLKQSLEDWMAPEMKLMQSVGIFDGGDEADIETSSTEADPKIIVSEREAWRKYKSSRSNVGAIGRSLYVLQLEEWIQAYISAGKTPSEEMIILTTEDIEENAESKFADLIRFMGLAPYDNKPENMGNGTTDSISSTLNKALAQKTNTEPMSEETRTMLRKFFKPYNKRLTELLTSYGFEGDWDERWK